MLRSSGLERLVVSENSLSDLWVMLVELDPSPLPSLLSLSSDDNYALRREYKSASGRFDVRVDGSDDNAVALIEMKGASSTHGDQLTRYSAWASRQTPAPDLFFCSFDRDEDDVPAAWTRLTLREMFAPWVDSSHAKATWLATQAVETLDRWHEEANAVLGNRTGYYVPDIVMKRLARELHDNLPGRFEGQAGSYPSRDFGGSPMLVAWAAHPQDSQDSTVSVGVDLRSPVRSSSGPWSFRPHVEVLPTGSRDQHSARLEALRLAQALHADMGLSALRAQLTDRGLEVPARALTAPRHDGFKSAPDEFDFASFADRVTTGRYPGGGLFGQDRGERLATILQLDIRELTRDDIRNLVTATVEILHESAAAVR